jgi:hypothetical protein
MPKASNSNGKYFKWAGWFILAYVSCAVHDDWRMRRGEHDMCILPALQEVLLKALG